MAGVVSNWPPCFILMAGQKNLCNRSCSLLLTFVSTALKPPLTSHPQNVHLHHYHAALCFQIFDFLPFPRAAMNHSQSLYHSRTPKLSLAITRYHNYHKPPQPPQTATNCHKPPQPPQTTTNRCNHHKPTQPPQTATNYYKLPQTL